MKFFCLRGCFLLPRQGKPALLHLLPMPAGPWGRLYADIISWGHSCHAVLVLVVSPTRAAEFGFCLPAAQFAQRALRGKEGPLSLPAGGEPRQYASPPGQWSVLGINSG